MQTFHSSLTNRPEDGGPYHGLVLIGVPQLDVAADVGRHQGGQGLGQQLGQNLPADHIGAWSSIYVIRSSLLIILVRLTLSQVVGSIGNAGLKKRLFHGIRAFQQQLAVDDFPEVGREERHRLSGQNPK